VSRARSYVTSTDASGRTHEADAYTCAHCNRIVVVEPKATLAGCRMCGPRKLICPRCDAVGSCTPFERRMERAEARDRTRRSMGL
jgi:DNA-directed RNA polymerase subunit RPC12/RpoP